MPEPTIIIDNAFARRIVDVFGERGDRWLAELPERAMACAGYWALTIHTPFMPLSYNYVAPCTRADGSSAVLKLGVPSSELISEMAALAHYDGRGAVRLIDSDRYAGAMLLERLEPGTPLSRRVAEGDDDVLTFHAAGVMRALWRPLPPRGHRFPTVADWLAGFGRLRARFDGGTGPLPARTVERAEGMGAEFLASSAEPVLLHGDLHHDNILAAERAPWLAIDPKGVIGEPAYEVGALLRNPMPHILEVAHPERVLSRRVARLSEELGLERERVRGWGFVQAVLSAWWSVEDHGSGWEGAIACAGYLQAGQ